MKPISLQWLAAFALAGAVLSAPVSTGKVLAKRLKLPRSHVEAVDFTNMTFTVVMQATNLTVSIAPESRFYLYGKAAIAKDLEPGDHVSGTLRAPLEGQPWATRIDIEKLAPK